MHGFCMKMQVFCNTVPSAGFWACIQARECDVFTVNGLVFPCMHMYNMHMMNDNSKTMRKLMKDLQNINKKLQILGENHRKMAEKQLKKVKNLRNSWGYPLHMFNRCVDSEHVLH
jgi:hypothetical protein